MTRRARSAAAAPAKKPRAAIAARGFLFECATRQCAGGVSRAAPDQSCAGGT
ncbi:hypothetical protein C7S16_1383 [Burkholderia thailandensis]|uniref:Lipoprotein n=1 Tax=Burkholderia thailandensis TaxID=57975 RepID=A0AAW9D643_BURTH|nr:hypothetical protein [Burkholderia thailandensis]MDW9257455.1 hypothetical protein [Burkholderia thailandensis]